MEKNQVVDVKGALYQVHGLVSFVIGATDCLDCVTGKDISDPVLSVAEVIQEKVEYCLAILDKMEKETALA